MLDKLRKAKLYLREARPYMMLSKYTDFFDLIDDLLFEIRMDMKTGRQWKAEEIKKELEKIEKEIEKRIERVVIKDIDEAWIILQDIDKEMRFQFVAMANRGMCSCKYLGRMDVKKLATISLREKLKIEKRELVKVLKNIFFIS